MSASVFFALEPLHRSRISRDEVMTAAVDPRTGGFVLPTEPKVFVGVDLHEWAARFFRDFDRLLVHPAFLSHVRGKRGIGGVKPRSLSPAVARLFAVRDLLAKAIADDLYPLSEPATDASGAAQAARDLEEARGRVCALGRRSLGSAFNVRLVELVPGAVGASAGPGLARWREFSLAEGEAAEAFAGIAEGLPLTLRSLPGAPSFLGQSGDVLKADPSDANPLRSAGRWRYSQDRRLPTAAQDELLLDFSTSAGAAGASAPNPELDLFAALARYLVAAPGLDSLLAPDAGPLTPEFFARAINTFADLAADVADCWTRRALESGAEAGGFAFRCRFRYDLAPSGRRRLLGVEITQGAAEAGLRLGWPELEVPGGEHRLERVREDADGSDTVARYRAAAGSGVEDDGTLALSFVWSGIDLLTMRRLQAVACVERNGCLPLPAGARVARRFVLRSPESAFVEPFVPSAVHGEPMVITAADPGEALERIFTDVLRFPAETTGEESSPFQIRVEVSYLFALTSPETSVTAMMPVLLLPLAPARRELVSVLRRATEDWFSSNTPSLTEAFWRIDCAVFDAEGRPARSWLRLADLRVPLAAAGAGASGRARSASGT